ncbi:MAG TPA: branched-chain amino acid ABC transporter permease [Actinomycetota bacterium]|nr:branched-chain amino acid ABC transporter permease [Actinomycetota bacterium]
MTAPAAAAWRPSRAGWAARVAVLVAVVGGVLVATAVVPQYWADRIALAAVYAIIGLSLNVVLGYAGQVSLGHHAFVGMSAFVSAAVVTNGGQSFFAGLLVAVVVGAASAALLGLVALRIHGLYLALITLTYGFVAVNSIFELPALTRAGAGMPAPRPDGFTSDRAYAYLCLAFLALCLFIDWRVVRSKVGRAILAVKESEVVASSYAVDVTAYKVIAFVLSGALAGLAGSLFAHRRTIVVANDFNFRDALLWVLMVVVGGLGNRTGVVIGSAFFALFGFLVPLVAPLERFVLDVLHREPDELVLVLGPLLALLTIIRFPGGIAQQIAPVTRWLRGERFTLHPDGRKPRRRPSLPARLRRGTGHPAQDESAPDAAVDDAPAPERPAPDDATPAARAATARGTED